MAPIPERADRHKNYLSIPASPPATLDGEVRKVYIAHRVMRGNGVVEQFTHAEQGIEKLLGEYQPQVPHPLHHWGVSVGDLIHHLQSDSFFGTPNYYENKKLPVDEHYILYEVGTTTFNDLAIQEAGVHTIYAMPETYDPISNNCQRFTRGVVDLIVRSGRVQVRTLEDVARDVDAFVPDSVAHLKKTYAQQQQQQQQHGTAAAVVEDPPAQKLLLQRVEAVMAENTPVVTRANIEAQLRQAAQMDTLAEGAKLPGTSIVEVPAEMATA